MNMPFKILAILNILLQPKFLFEKELNLFITFNIMQQYNIIIFIIYIYLIYYNIYYILDYCIHNELFDIKFEYFLAQVSTIKKLLIRSIKFSKELNK